MLIVNGLSLKVFAVECMGKTRHPQGLTIALVIAMQFLFTSASLKVICIMKFFIYNYKLPLNIAIAIIS